MTTSIQLFTYFMTSYILSVLFYIFPSNSEAFALLENLDGICIRFYMESDVAGQSL